jgi:hypothetical protein
MITIDIAQMHRTRAPYAGPSFRRNDNDRRPARPVIRPNDSPGSLEERQRLAAARLEAATRRRYPTGDFEANRLERIKHETRALLVAVADLTAPANLRTVANIAMVPADRASTLMVALYDDGLISKDRVPNGKGGREVHVAITEAGRSKLSEDGQ